MKESEDISFQSIAWISFRGEADEKPDIKLSNNNAIILHYDIESCPT